MTTLCVKYAVTTLQNKKYLRTEEFTNSDEYQKPAR